MTNQADFPDLAELKRLAEAASIESPGASWAFEPHGDTGEYGVGVLVNEQGNYVEGCQGSCEMSVVVPVAPEVSSQVFAAFIAAANPSVVLALIAENERYDEGMRAIACQLGAGGYNATELTADQLLAKVCDGLNAFTDTSGCLLDQVRSERDQLKSAVDSLSEAVRGAIKYVAFAFDQGIEGAESAGLAMEEAVVMAGQL